MMLKKVKKKIGKSDNNQIFTAHLAKKIIEETCDDVSNIGN